MIVKIYMSENFLYVINYQDNEESICALEMKCLFGITIDKKWLYSDIDIQPSRSVFIKYRMSMLFTANSVEDIEQYIRINDVVIKSFKFLYVNIDKNEIDYCLWKQIVARICIALKNTETHDKPEVFLSIIHLDNIWILGTCVKNNNEWKYHEYKPNTNSHSLSTRIARSIVNIAIENNFDISLVDPCCGVGTVVIEAASMGLKIKGYEVNRKVAESAKENLAFFGVNNVIVCNNMHTINEHFGVSIVDIPYGLFTAISKTEQTEIIKTARRISDKSVIITFDNMENAITEAGFRILQKCYVSKGKFTRYINVCA